MFLVVAWQLLCSFHSPLSTTGDDDEGGDGGDDDDGDDDHGDGGDDHGVGGDQVSYLSAITTYCK